MNDIDIFSRLQKLISIFQRINQLSWTADQTRKRYPAPEAMTIQEMESLTKTYLALGIDLEDIYKEWLEEYKKFKKNAI